MIRCAPTFRLHCQWLLAGLFALGALGLAACAGPARERFYHLDAVAAEGAAGAAGDYDGDLRVVVQDVPDAVDRPQIVLQSRPNEVEILENDRWAESVRSGITRALVQDLGHELPRAWVTAEGPLRGGRLLTVVVQVDVMRGARSGETLLAARWLVRGADGVPGASDRIELRRAAPGTPAGVVAAWSADIALLAQAIARDLPAAPR